MWNVHKYYFGNIFWKILFHDVPIFNLVQDLHLFLVDSCYDFQRLLLCLHLSKTQPFKCCEFDTSNLFLIVRWIWLDLSWLESLAQFFGVMLLLQQLLDCLCVVSKIYWYMKWYHLFITMISGHLTYCLMSISRYVIVKFGHDSKWVAILRKLLLPSQLLVLIYYFTVRAIVDKYVRSLNGTQEVNYFQKDIIQYM